MSFHINYTDFHPKTAIFKKIDPNYMISCGNFPLNPIFGQKFQLDLAFNNVKPKEKSFVFD